MKKHLNKIMAGVFLLMCLAVTILCVMEYRGKSSDDIIILYTNDVHCGIEENIGYAGLAAYKESAELKTPYVTLVDLGDSIQGDFIGITSDGAYMIDLMNRVGYDLGILGNHEFDYGMEQLESLIGQAEYQYLGCNITYTGSGENRLEALLPYEIINYGDVDVAFIGVTTPASPSSSTPSYFMEEDEYVYDFADGQDGEELYTLVQGYVDECREQGAEYVVLLTHLGDGEEFAHHSSNALANATEGIDVILDGHAHSVLPCRVEKNKNGEEVLISSTGTKLSNIGQLVITADGNMTTGLISWYEEKDEEMAAAIDEIQATYEADLAKVVGSSENILSGSDEAGVRMVRNRETTIGNFCADAYRIVSGADIALVNGGGVRADFPKGDITYEDLFAVHPFGNTLCMVETTGQEILDCLETCYRFVEAEYAENGNPVGEDGGFQQVSGLKVTVDTSIEPSVTMDENEMFVSVDGERRVKNVQVLNPETGAYEDLDPNQTYTLASHNYLLKEGGSGCPMFADNVFLIDEGMADYQILITYLECLGGTIGDEYAKPEGRITIE